MLDARDDPGKLYFGRSCWIPLDELDSRLHELPPPGSPLFVPSSQAETLDFLAQIGRPATPVETAPDLTKCPRTRLWHTNPLLDLARGKGRALDLGCGSGRDALALSASGYHVTAVDWLETAVQKARELEWRTFGDNLIDWEVRDLRYGFPEGKFDLIVMFSFFKIELLRTAFQHLTPGGQLMIEMFTEEHQAAMGKPKHVTSERELMGLLGEMQCSHLESGWRGDRHTVRGAWIKPDQPIVQ